jgi:tellurite resistance protein
MHYGFPARRPATRYEQRIYGGRADVSGLLDRFSDHTRRIFARHRGRSFLEGAMAAAALIALADGDASLEEGAEVGRLMRVLDTLRDHNPDQGVESYLRYIDRLRKNPADQEAIREVVLAAAGNDKEAAALLVVICHAVSEADGIVRDSEVEEIRKISELLDVDSIDAAELIVPQISNA